MQGIPAAIRLLLDAPSENLQRRLPAARAGLLHQFAAAGVALMKVVPRRGIACRLGRNFPIHLVTKHVVGVTSTSTTFTSLDNSSG